MPPRRSHPKSRLGCAQCKLRRVKCDESRPICTNCDKRGGECSYTFPEPSEQSPELHGLPLSRSKPQQKHNLTSAYSRRPTSATHELALMHQWSLSTYACLGQKDDEREKFRIDLTRTALDNTYLLNAMFSMTSLHMAALTPRDAGKYGGMAITYHGHALSVFRETLLDPSPPAEQCPALFYSSILIGITAFALPRLHPTPSTPSDPVATLMNLSRMLQGCGVIIEIGKQQMGMEAWTARFPDEPTTTITPLDADALHVLERLMDLADEGDRTNPIRTPSRSADEECNVGVYANSVRLLRHFYEIGEHYQGKILAWPPMTGPHFMERLERHDPLASVITMCYGVVLLFLDDRWWATGSGKQLVQAISPGIRADKPHWLDIAEWAERKVGIDSASA